MKKLQGTDPERRERPLCFLIMLLKTIPKGFRTFRRNTTTTRSCASDMQQNGGSICDFFESCYRPRSFKNCLWRSCKYVTEILEQDILRIYAKCCELSYFTARCLDKIGIQVRTGLQEVQILTLSPDLKIEPKVTLTIFFFLDSVVIGDG
jgi:hypothetical protein